MSDDERMDRAERIRKMREGNRDETETDGESSADGETADAETTDGAASDTERDEPADDGATDRTATPDGNSTANSTTTAEADPQGAKENGDGPAQSTRAGTESSASSADEGDAAADAAQRAAQAAAQVTGGTGDATASTDQPTEITAEAAPMQGPTGVELPDQQLLEEAMTGGTDRTEGAARAAAVEEETSQSEELARVLEFALGDEYYCLDIEYVEEIVKRDTMTRVPNTADYIEGVVDLRGQITTILDPIAMMDIDSDGERDLIVVFDPEIFEEQGAIGWAVDEVRQVAPVTEAQVNDPPVDADYIKGVVDRDDQDQFVLWVEPDDALAEATDGDE